MLKKTYRILGIDTSLRSSGIGVIEVNKEKMSVIAYGRIHNKSTETHSSCLKQIYNTISEIIDQHRPDHVAIEGAFFSKNAKNRRYKESPFLKKLHAFKFLKFLFIYIVRYGGGACKVS